MNIIIFQEELAKNGNNYDETCLAPLYQLFRKQYPYGTTDDILVFLRDHHPLAGHINIQSVLSKYGNVDSGIVSLACKWLKTKKVSIATTISGYYISLADAEVFDNFLSSARAVRPLFDSYCIDNNIAPTPAVYENFRAFSKGQLEQSLYHPFMPEYREFWTGSDSDLTWLLCSWSVHFLSTLASPIDGMLSASEAAEHLDVAAATLIDYCLTEQLGCIHAGMLLLNPEDIDRIITYRDSFVALNPIIDDIVSFYPPSVRVAAKRQLVAVAKTAQEISLVNNPFVRSQKELYTTGNNTTVRCVLEEIAAGLPLIPLTKATIIASMGYAELVSNIHAGKINATERDGRYYISQNEKCRIDEIASEYVPITTVISSLVPSGSSFSLRLANCRSSFLEYCNENGWWEIDIIQTDDYPIRSDLLGRAVAVEDAETFTREVSLWIKGYGLSAKEQIAVVCDHYRATFPNTVKSIFHYMSNREIGRMHVDMTMLLLESLSCELENMEEDEIQKELIDRFDAQATRASCDVLADFLVSEQYTQRQYRFQPYGFTIEKSAYPIKDFAVMMACAINDSIVHENQLIQKAVDNPKFAQLWLWVTLHFFAAWRSTDFIRLEAPILALPPLKVLEMISEGSFSDRNYITIAEQYITRMATKWRRPNKTSKAACVPPLTFLLPESCKPIFGMILAIAGAHYGLSDKHAPFVQKVVTSNYIVPFFGAGFWNACGQKNFSGRRANKALMQAVETQSEVDVNPIAAYAIASIMRSHKGRYAKLSETTDIYLRDGKFQGYSVNTIAYLMAERGPCSFVVDYLLEKCFGSYMKLPAFEKTVVTKQLGLTPLQVDRTLRLVQTARKQAREIVAELVTDDKQAEHALIRLCSGNAPGKELSELCIRKAAYKPCICPERSNCLGCKYEIRTKAVLQNYLTAYSHTQPNGSDNLSPVEQNKNMWLRTNIIEPILLEYAVHLKKGKILGEDTIAKQMLLEGLGNGRT